MCLTSLRSYFWVVRVVFAKGVGGALLSVLLSCLWSSGQVFRVSLVVGAVSRARRAAMSPNRYRGVLRRVLLLLHVWGTFRSLRAR